MSAQRIVMIEPAAPAKPAPGQACNGCGVCCLVEPCPLGRLLSRRRRGACVVLRWEGWRARYVCGALAAPAMALHSRWPRMPARWVGLLAPLLARLATRWIALGSGCDCSWEIERRMAPEVGHNQPHD